MHLVSKCILGSLRSCCGWRANNSIEAKWIWIAKHFNHRCCHFITYITFLSHRRRDVAWDRQSRGSSHVHGSRVFWAHPHSSWCWRGFLDSDADTPPLHPLLCTVFTSEASSSTGAAVPCRAPWQFWFSCAILWAHQQLLWPSGPVCTVPEDTWLIIVQLLQYSHQLTFPGWSAWLTAPESDLHYRNATFPFCPVKHEGHADTKGQMWHSAYAKRTHSHLSPRGFSDNSTILHFQIPFPLSEITERRPSHTHTY